MSEKDPRAYLGAVIELATDLEARKAALEAKAFLEDDFDPPILTEKGFNTWKAVIVHKGSEDIQAQLDFLATLTDLNPDDRKDLVHYLEKTKKLSELGRQALSISIISTPEIGVYNLKKTESTE
jgi:hypothetical protein